MGAAGGGADDRYPSCSAQGCLLEHWHTGSMTRRVPQLHNALPEAVLDMNRADCERLGSQMATRCA